MGDLRAVRGERHRDLVRVADPPEVVVCRGLGEDCLVVVLQVLVNEAGVQGFGEVQAHGPVVVAEVEP